ncbi:MAG: hypothetical protein KKE02_10200 [Alphaproteobacteria bacterium]|nr:hypothetical protein [Alphaproteobacteria bacterium]MBU1514572.1 hypothetical protein [Alphaproteobacteria bacterium]MBU2096796.1 hypothetical protein [Alphaproteobacteria bacterium]MBU2151378.1 hypothetical protein [Alphaproteobacteria bacterium]MBU2307879.1 hypothetical protein [Alphaproteobacteria bacterium]
MALFDFLKGGRPQDRFAEAVMARLKAAGWPHEVTYDRSAFSLTTRAEGDVLHLDKVYRDWLTYPRREQAAQLDRVIAPVFEARIVESFEDAAPRLLPIVRSLTDLQAVALDADNPSTEVWQPYQRLAGPLAAVLAVDLPNSISFVQHGLLRDWGRTFEELLPRAMDNLVAISPVRFEATDGGFHVSTYEDGYDSSRLLMPELFLALGLKGAPVAVAVTRDHVVVAGGEDVRALQAMAAHVVRAFNAATRPLAWLPLILRDRKWEAFEGALTPELGAIRDLFIRQSIWDYGLQTPRLETLFAEQERDVFVAPFEFVVVDRDAFTWTSWTQDVPALLPKAQGLAMTLTDGQDVFRLWSDIEAVCGPFAEDATFHPPRYRPPAWPDGDAVERLRRDFPTPEWWLAATA